MNATDDLIARLASEGGRQSGSAAMRFAMPLLLVSLSCIAATALVLDEPFPTYNLRGWLPMAVKWGFSIPLLLLAAVTLHLAGQPGRAAGWMFAAMLLPLAWVAWFGVPSLLYFPQPFPGEAWQRCLAAMAIMSPVGFFGAIAATRYLAPTNLRRAGLVAGLFGGALAMTAYAPFCPGEGMIYFLLYYLSPIAAIAAIGWLAGPRLLRW